MTNVSLGTGRQRKTHHISYSCGHTAGFLVVLGVSLLRCHAFAFFQFFFFLVCSGGAIVYPELDGVIEICVGFFFAHSWSQTLDCIATEWIIWKHFVLVHKHKNTIPVVLMMIYGVFYSCACSMEEQKGHGDGFKASTSLLRTIIHRFTGVDVPYDY